MKLEGKCACAKIATNVPCIPSIFLFNNKFSEDLVNPVNEISKQSSINI
jgi:hypothetical protein